MAVAVIAVVDTSEAGNDTLAKRYETFINITEGRADPYGDETIRSIVEELAGDDSKERTAVFARAIVTGELFQTDSTEVTSSTP